jgi:hypothetical protein
MIISSPGLINIEMEMSLIGTLNIELMGLDRRLVEFKTLPASIFISSIVSGCTTSE